MKNKLVIGAFVLMLAAFVTFLALPADKKSIEAENRAMSTPLPFTGETVFSGDFASGYESFIGDSVGCRSFFTQLSGQIESLKGITPSSGKVVAANKDIGTGTTLRQTVLIADRAIMEMFVRDPRQEAVYADAVNHYAEKLPENIKLFNMLIPTQLEFKEPIYKNLQDSQSAVIDAIYGSLDERVIKIDAVGALEPHSDEYIYLRTDHHWTQLGAYYAYRKFMETEGGEAVDKDSFEVGKIQNMLGFLYENVSSDEADVDPDTIEWYDLDKKKRIRVVMYNLGGDGEFERYDGTMYDRKKTNYNFFFGSDHPVVEMTNTDRPDGKTLAVIKDSYTNALAPWLIKSYHKVILVDPRIYKGDFQDIIDKFSPDETLITNYIFTTNFADYCDMLKNLYR